MNTSIFRLCSLLLAFCLLNAANAFTLRLPTSRPAATTSIMAETKTVKESRVKRVAKKVKSKLGLGPKAKNVKMSKAEMEKLTKKYAKIDDVEEMAYQVLVDLGMV